MQIYKFISNYCLYKQWYKVLKAISRHEDCKAERCALLCSVISYITCILAFISSLVLFSHLLFSVLSCFVIYCIQLITLAYMKEVSSIYESCNAKY